MDIQNTDDSAASSARVPPADLIQAELSRLVAHPQLAASPSVCRFLTFVVEGALQGRQSQLKEYVIGVEAMSRGTNFDPRLDPIVRVQARKLRAKLKAYYETEGAGNPLRIEIPRGSYVPAFRYAVAEAPAEDPSPAPEPLEEQGQPERQLKPEAAGHPSFAWLVGRKRMVAGATGVLLLGLGWLICGDYAATPAHVEIAVAPAPTALLDRDTITLCAHLAHELDDVIEDAEGLRSTAPLDPEHNAIRKLHLHMPPPGATLRSTVDAVGSRLSVNARLESSDGRLLWAGGYDAEKSDIGGLSHAIARDFLTNTARPELKPLASSAALPIIR